jgi:hypothetical protein
MVSCARLRIDGGGKSSNFSDIYFFLHFSAFFSHKSLDSVTLVLHIIPISGIAPGARPEGKTPSPAFAFPGFLCRAALPGPRVRKVRKNKYSRRKERTYACRAGVRPLLGSAAKGQ